jgi:hypothetical protein
MFLSIKEMELRKVRFDETFPPGQVDFSGVEVRQAGPLHAAGSAELLANTVVMTIALYAVLFFLGPATSVLRERSHPNQFLYQRNCSKIPLLHVHNLLVPFVP